MLSGLFTVDRQNRFSLAMLVRVEVLAMHVRADVLVLGRKSDGIVPVVPGGDSTIGRTTEGRHRHEGCEVGDHVPEHK